MKRERFQDNPISGSHPEHPGEDLATFNPAARCDEAKKAVLLPDPAAESGPEYKARPFQFCCRCGNDQLSAETPRCFRCARCGFRHYINPIGAAVAILTDRAGDLLLLRRAHNPGQGRLGLPGGFVEPGETGEAALRREIREEIGLEVSGFKYLASLPSAYPYQGLVTPVLDLVFTAQVASFAEARAVSEVEELVVVAPHRIDFSQLAFRSNAEALRRFLATGVRERS